jgi:hypothetical protein
LTEPQKGEVKEEDKAKFKEDFDEVSKEIRSLTSSLF